MVSDYNRCDLVIEKNVLSDSDPYALFLVTTACEHDVRRAISVTAIMFWFIDLVHKPRAVCRRKGVPTMDSVRARPISESVAPCPIYTRPARIKFN